MSIPQALCLGLLQGITEFLPVSSSGHLVLVQHLFGLREPELLFDIVVHAGTLGAVLVMFRADLLGMIRDLRQIRPLQAGTWAAAGNRPGEGARLLWLLVLGSTPTALIGALFRDTFEGLFASAPTVGLALWATGLLLLWSRWARHWKMDLPTPLDALLVGLAQGVAITPGISRSGATIVASLLRGLKPELAFRFSFLLSIPAILGAMGLEVFHLGAWQHDWQVLMVGFLSAFVVGCAALKILLAVVGRGRLFYFAPYCFAVGTLVIVFAG